MGVRARSNRWKERMLAVEDPVGDHSDVVSIEERYRPDRASTGSDPPSRQGFSDEVSKCLGTAPVTSFANESVELFEQRPFEGNANSGNGHRQTRLGKTSWEQE